MIYKYIKNELNQTYTTTKLNKMLQIGRFFDTIGPNAYGMSAHDMYSYVTSSKFLFEFPNLPINSLKEEDFQVFLTDPYINRFKESRIKNIIKDKFNQQLLAFEVSKDKSSIQWFKEVSKILGGNNAKGKSKIVYVDFNDRKASNEKIPPRAYDTFLKYMEFED